VNEIMLKSTSALWQWSNLLLLFTGMCIVGMIVMTAIHSGQQQQRPADQVEPGEDLG
jgi:hypothetical protein